MIEITDRMADITERRFGRLVALHPEDRTTSGHLRWRCRCDCGKESVVKGAALRDGSTQSCGCLAREASAERNVRRMKPLTGQTFGTWTVLGISHRTPSRSGGGGNTYWRCRCRCGREAVLQRGALTHRKDPHCIDCENASRLTADWHIGRLWKRYLFNAQNRGLAFELTRSQFAGLVASPCHYCGEAGVDEILHDNGRDVARHVGVDRRITADGYTVANSVPCCWRCNRAKGPLDEADFIALCRAVAERAT